MLFSLNDRQCDRGNRTLNWSQICDGIIDCFDRSDEEGHLCKLCVNNLYSCLPTDNIRCDLACQTLGYVPCQTIQDRRACNIILKTYEKRTIFQFVEQLRIHIIVSISILVFLLSLYILFKYLHRRTTNSSSKLSKLSHSIEVDRLSSHIYEQCSESVSDTYEHIV